MKKKYNPIELGTGFLMGSFPALMIELAVIAIINQFCRWRECDPVNYEWWMLIPLPLIVGVFMAIGIASLHLEDY
jgi:hypothetical protein